jgi:hypothetical protein
MESQAGRESEATILVAPSVNLLFEAKAVFKAKPITTALP